MARPKTKALGIRGVVTDLSGLAELKSLATQRAVTLKAVRAGAKVVARAAKGKAPKRKGSGALRQAIGVKAQKGKRGKSLAFAVVGARKKVEKSLTRGNKTVRVVPAFYAHLVELGTKPHSLGGGAKLARRGKDAAGQGGGRRHPGTRPRPFLKPALDYTRAESADAAMKVLGAELSKAIQKQAARLAKKLAAGRGR